MPNWCSTDIRIYHHSRIKLRRFIKKLDEWTRKNYCENGFGLTWLGNIVGNSGVGTPLGAENKELFACRGTLDGYELKDDHISLCMETAWNPTIKMWLAIIDKYLPDGELLYTALEPNNGLYCTNDPDLEGKYMIEYWGGNDDEDSWKASEDQVVELLQMVLDTKEEDVEVLLEMVEDHDELTDELSIHKWDFVPSEDWD